MAAAGSELRIQTLRAEAALEIAGVGDQRALSGRRGALEWYNSLEGIWPVYSHLGGPSTSQPTCGTPSYRNTQVHTTVKCSGFTVGKVNPPKGSLLGNCLNKLWSLHSIEC